MIVPEPEVKALLAEAGVRVPKGVAVAYDEVVADPSVLADTAAAEGLAEPLVLKGYGGGLVHKSDVGAVRLGLAAYELNFEAAEMARRITDAKVALEGFLVEEQADPGVELIVGVVDRPPFGPVVALGLGGVLTEVLDEVVLRLAPLSRTDAEAMVSGFRGAEMLAGFRGSPPADIDAVVEVLMGIAGPGGVVEKLGRGLLELECNPVIAGPNGAIAVDAQLSTRSEPAEVRPSPPATDFGPLFAPRGIAVAGASTRGAGFGNTFLAAYQELGWGPGTLWAIHPSAAEVDGVPAVASVADIDGDVDYVVAAVPAPACADLVTSAAGKAGFVHVISGGFREADPEGSTLEEALGAAARESGVRVLGPNCLGAYSPAGRQTFLRNAPTEVGRVAMISQSGGLAGDMVKAGAVRGIRYTKLCTVGNSVDVTPGELLEWLVDDPDTDIIGLYVEDPRDGRRLYDALLKARGRKPVVALVGGLTAQGGGAAVSHTGALVADRRIWDAIGAATGTSVVGTMDELLSAIAYLQRWSEADIGGDLDTLVIGVGGGASVLGTDAADRAGLVTTPVSEQGQQAVRSLGYGVGTSIRNPIEIGFGPVSEPDVLVKALDPILEAQPYPDVVVHSNVQAFFSYGGEGIERLFPIIKTTAARGWLQTRLSMVLRNLDCAPPDVAVRIQQACRDADLPTFTRFDEAMAAVAAAKRYARFRASG